MMPELDGIQVLTQMRRTKNIPVIFLTAKGEDTDKILGLNLGADDYVTKPFNPVELLARVKSQLRRYMELGAGTMKKDSLTGGGHSAWVIGRKKGELWQANRSASRRRSTEF